MNRALGGRKKRLISAIKSGDTDIVKGLLKRGVDINFIDSEGFTPLIQACKKMDYDMVELLLRSSADVNKTSNEGLTALIYAVRSEDLQMIDILLRNGANIKNVKKNGVWLTNVPIVKQYLINANASQNNRMTRKASLHRSASAPAILLKTNNNAYTRRASLQRHRNLSMASAQAEAARRKKI